MERTEAHARTAVVQAAQAYLEGRAGVVETSRLISDLVRTSNFSADDLLVGFTAIDSESDTFPLGACRDTWDPVALAREDLVRERFEASMAQTMAYMCRQAVATFA